jgi:hypothetical protein
MVLALAEVGIVVEMVLNPKSQYQSIIKGELAAAEAVVVAAELATMALLVAVVVAHHLAIPIQDLIIPALPIQHGIHLG